MIVAPNQQQSQIDSTNTYQYLTWPSTMIVASQLYLVPRSKKKCNYKLRAMKNYLCLIKFLINNIHIYDFKLI